MRKKFKSDDLQEKYDFLNLHFLPNKWHIAIEGLPKPIPLTRMQREFLLVLVKNPNELVSYDDLRRAIWTHESEVDQRLIHTMHAAKSKLVRLFTDHKIDAAFLESVDGKGYKLNALVTHEPASYSAVDLESQSVDELKHLEDFTDEQYNGSTLPTDFIKQSKIGFKFWQLVFGCVLTAIISITFWHYYLIDPVIKDTETSSKSSEGVIEAHHTDRNIKGESAPLLEKAEYISNPVPKKEFYISLKGKDINPERVRLRVTGPGCGGDDPCTVPNGVLRLYGKITETSVEKVPLTLGHGEYSLWLENDTGFTSNKLTIAIQ